MTSTRIAGSLTVCMLLLALAATAAEPASPEKTGLAVGQQAPDFTLKDQNGRDVSLSALLEKGPVAARLFPVGQLVTLLPEAVGSTAISGDSGNGR